MKLGYRPALTRRERVGYPGARIAAGLDEDAAAAGQSFSSERMLLVFLDTIGRSGAYAQVADPESAAEVGEADKDLLVGGVIGEQGSQILLATRSPSDDMPELCLYLLRDRPRAA